MAKQTTPSPTPVLVTVDKDEIAKSTDVIQLARKADVIIETDEQCNEASAILSDIKKRAKELDEQRKSITKPLDDAKKQIMDLFRHPLDLLSRAENHLKNLILNYTTEKERKAREEAERLRKLAEAEAEKERKRLEAQMKKAEEKGKLEKVEELKAKVEEVVNTPIIVPTVEVEKPKGISYREKWYAEVVDFKVLPDEYKIPNQQALDKVAQATKGTIQIPGVIFKKEQIVVSR